MSAAVRFLSELTCPLATRHGQMSRPAWSEGHRLASPFHTTMSLLMSEDVGRRLVHRLASSNAISSEASCMLSFASAAAAVADASAAAAVADAIARAPCAAGFRRTQENAPVRPHWGFAGSVRTAVSIA